MRAYEILDEAKWKDMIGPAAYLAAAGGVYAQPHQGDPNFLKDPYTQSQEELTNTATMELPSSKKIVGRDTSKEHSDSAKASSPDATASSEMSKDAKLLALTIWGEARGEGEAGMRAVGHVIKNRMKSSRFGDSVEDVVWKRKAFSCWNPSDPNREAMRNIARLPKDSVEYKRWKLAKKIATQILANKSHDPTSGSLFYHTANISPNWAKGVNAVAQVANHLFYKMDAKALPQIGKDG